MKLVEIQSNGARSEDKDAHDDLSTIRPETSNTPKLTQPESVEVRFPIFDERRPAKGASDPELFPPDSDRKSSPKQHPASPLSAAASSATSSPLSSDTSSFIQVYSPEQTHVGDNISSTDLISIKQISLSSPDDSHSEDSALSEKPDSEAQSSSNSSNSHKRERHQRRAVRNEGLKLARLRYQENKSKQQQSRHLEDGVEFSATGHRETPIAPLTLRQSKPASGIEDRSFSGHKPVIRLPSRPVHMSHPVPSNFGVGSTRGFPLPSSLRNGKYQPPSYRPHKGGGKPVNPTSRYGPLVWTTWQEVSVRIRDIPPTTTTRDLWRCFSKQGTIVGIELYENTKGKREGSASVKFR